ncbi:MAG: phage terminase large subunit [Candidatus Thermoplasmatota archaeon]|nr:phage terminase large subunit [Candidatus Thermoplasmatota archaeon]
MKLPAELRNIEITPEMIEQELARRHLLDFTQLTFPGYQTNWHHKKICEILDKVVAGKIKRLMIFTPPRHGKTELVSRRLPAYILGRDPGEQIIATSYSADLAGQNNRDVQRIIASDAYQAIFPETFLADDPRAFRYRGDYQQNSDMFEIPGRPGFYKSAGVGGGITGRGFTCGLIDDPIKNAEEANSPVYREKVWEWYTSTFYTRAEKDARIIIILTRWHEDDLAGRLLEQQENEPFADRWTILEIPAIKEDDNPDDPRKTGEPLWPEKYSLEVLETIKSTLSGYQWAALYQQKPKPREGNMFRREWFEIIDIPPADMRKIRYWDLAATEPAKGKDPAYTAGALVGEKDGIFYICDIRRRRSRPAGIEALVKQTAELDGKRVNIYMEQEPGSSGVGVIDHYARKVLFGFAFRGDKVTGAKEWRAEPLCAAAENGNVKLVRGTWNKDFLDEAETFPHGKFKDQVDAVSGAHSKLQEVEGKGLFLVARA